MTQIFNLPRISHDLRNYIGGISGMARLIAEDISSYIQKQEAKGIKSNEDIMNLEDLKEISNNAKILAPYSNEALSYIDDLLNSTSEENSKSNLKSNWFTLGESEDCDVGALTRELLIFNESLILKHKVFVTTQIQENLPKLKCDVFRLKQILINLITNAVKYSYSGGLVTISAYLKDNQICIEVSDGGIGMSEEEVAMALSGKGTQIDKSALNKNISVDSHGIGLPNVVELVRVLNGNIEISSEKNLGTRITLLFNQTL